MARRYDASTINVSSPLEGVRKHPGMYLGDTDANGTLQCFNEILKNATDEMEEVGGGKVFVKIANKSVWIADEGRGIPVEKHTKTKKSALETVFTHLHAGGKSGNKTAYGSRTIGVHGVGASVVNALSTLLEVWTNRKGKWYHLQMQKGVVFGKLATSRPPFKWKCGTIVRYVLDETILPEALTLKSSRSLCNIARHFSPVDIIYSDGEKSATLLRKQPKDLLDRVITNEDLETTLGPFIVDDNGVRCVLSWTNATDCVIQGHVSGTSVPSGTHVAGLEDAIKAAMQAAMPRDAKNCDDVSIGIRAILDVTVDQPSFSGQAKTTLRTAKARKQVATVVTRYLTNYIKHHKEAAKVALEHATRISKLDTQHAEMKKLAKASDMPRGKFSFPAGFVGARSFPPEKRELYLVEGKSALGTAKDAKMPWQEILPLRGKMANVINKKGAINKSEVIGNILRVIGYDPRNPNKPLSVNKVCILCDADEDGHHIAVLLLTVFVRVMPSMLKEGRVFLVDAPLFEAVANGQQVAGNKLVDMERQYGKLTQVNRMKGWGGCKVPLLRKIAFHTDSRRLLRVDEPSQKDVVEFLKLMGADSSARKKLLEAPLVKGHANEKSSDRSGSPKGSVRDRRVSNHRNDRKSSVHLRKGHGVARR